MDGMTWLWNDGQCELPGNEADQSSTITTTLPQSCCWGRGEYTLRWTRISMPPGRRRFLLRVARGSRTSTSTSGASLAMTSRARARTDPRRDRPKFNPTILFSLFPSISMLYPEDWADLKNHTTSFEPRAFLLERALLADRSAAFYGEWTAPTSRTVASALHVGTVSRWWWEPIRRQILRYAGVSEDVLDRSLEGYGAVDVLSLNGRLQAYHDYGAPVGDYTPVAKAGSYTPLVTYISRQKSRRRLTPDSHNDLLRHMEQRALVAGFEFLVVEAEKLTHEEQFALAGRTTVRKCDTWLIRSCWVCTGTV